MTETHDIEPIDIGAQAEAAEHIDAFLAEFQDKGFRAVLSRKSPSWCSGYLETRPLDSELTLESIKETWGGRDFDLRIINEKGQFHKFRSFRIAADPLVEGRPLAQVPGREYKNGGQEIVINHEAAADATKALLAQMEAERERSQRQIEAERDRNQQLIVQLLQQRNDQPPAPPLPSPQEQLNSMIGLFGAMKSFMADFGATPGQEQNSFLTPDTINRFFDLIDKKRQAQQEAQQQPKQIRAPITHGPGASAQTAAPQLARQQESAALPNPGPASKPAEVEDDEEYPSIAEELGEGGPRLAIESLAGAMSMWTPEQQKEFFDLAGAAVQNAPELDNKSIPTKNSSEPIKEAQGVDDGEKESHSTEDRSAEGGAQNGRAGGAAQGPFTV